MNESTAPLRLEIAAAAARLIADAGLDYASAKRKAVRQLIGDGGTPKGLLPDNDEIDSALEAWGRRLEAIVSGRGAKGEVVAMTGRKPRLDSRGSSSQYQRGRTP